MCIYAYNFAIKIYRDYNFVILDFFFNELVQKCSYYIVQYKVLTKNVRLNQKSKNMHSQTEMPFLLKMFLDII